MRETPRAWTRLWPTWCALLVVPILAICMSIAAIVVYALAAGVDLDHLETPTVSMAGTALLSVALTFALAAILLAALSPEPWRLRLRFERTSPKRALLFTLATPVTMGASTLLESALFDAPSKNMIALAEALQNARGWGAAILFFSIIVAAPVGEELFFRGYVQGRLERRLPAAAAMTISSLAFALVHLETQHVVGVLPFAFWAGFAVWHTQSVWVGISCHMYNNAIVAVASRFAPVEATPWDDPASLTLLALSLVSIVPFVFAVRTPRGRTLDGAWPTWLTENLARGCAPDELASILTRQGFSDTSIREHMERDAPPAKRRLGERDYRAIAATRLTHDPIHRQTRRVDTEKLQLYVLDEFVSDLECEQLIRIIDRRLRPSTVTKGGSDARFRTSRTCDLSLLDEPLVATLDARIARALGVRESYSEHIQAQWYDVGQEFKAHTDYFDRGTPDFSAYTAEAGNRTWTFMVYLNDDLEGGSTKFHAIDLEFRPKRGQAVVWNNRRVDGMPNPDTLHSGTPVTRGHKIIITKWFREKGSGPMFY
ncbi:MAG: CPBP family glutamic-type intramembrane protease [Polyangiales bacterium]